MSENTVFSPFPISDSLSHLSIEKSDLYTRRKANSEENILLKSKINLSENLVNYDKQCELRNEHVCNFYADNNFNSLISSNQNDR